MKFLCLVIFPVLLLSCSSKKEFTKKDINLLHKETFNDKEIGIDDNDHIVIKKEISLNDELEITKLKNYDLEEKLESILFETKWCFKDIRDQRLSGGNTNSKLNSSYSSMKKEVESKESIVLTENNNLKLVSISNFSEELKANREYGKSLKKVINEMNLIKESCENEMREKRLSAGLPAERYKAKVEYVGGKPVITQKPERNLDDAFLLLNKVY